MIAGFWWQFPTFRNSGRLVAIYLGSREGWPIALHRVECQSVCTKKRTPGKEDTVAAAKKPMGRSAAGDDAASARVVIKKYANRRLYNTARSTYVTLEDLSKMVRDGEDFAVFDAKTGEEITRSVLTQIIFEEESKGQNMLPTNFLRQLIRLYGDTLQSVVPTYLDASMEAFSRNQERMRAAFGNNPAMQNFEALTRSNMEFFEQAFRLFSPFAGNATTGAPPNGAAAPETSAEVKDERGGDLDDLQRQLSEMKAQIEKLTSNRD
ncbi:MAG: polyhydroxyalkanoate synthesis repressor PhaR [Pseudomonadota bacterium]